MSALRQLMSYAGRSCIVLLAHRHPGQDFQLQIRETADFRACGQVREFISTCVPGYAPPRLQLIAIHVHNLRTFSGFPFEVPPSPSSAPVQAVAPPGAGGADVPAV